MLLIGLLGLPIMVVCATCHGMGRGDIKMAHMSGASAHRLHLLVSVFKVDLCFPQSPCLSQLLADMGITLTSMVLLLI